MKTNSYIKYTNVLSYYLVFSGGLGLLTVLMVVLKSPPYLNFLYFFYIIYMSLVNIFLIYFSVNLKKDDDSRSYLGLLIIMLLSLMVFNIQGFKYSVIIGFGLIFSIEYLNNLIFNFNFVISDYSMEYSTIGSGFSIGINFSSLLILLILFKFSHMKRIHSDGV